MNGMSTPYEAGGRAAQKSRTRTALVAAAREMVAQGLSPSVSEAADAAGVSRTTAYRYFPNQRDILTAAHPETGRRSLLGDDPSDDPESRLDAVAEAFTTLIAETEAQQRTMLRLSLTEGSANPGGLPLRQGRAIGWISEALDPVRDQLTDQGVASLSRAIRSAIGIEALVWLTDIGGLTRAEAAAQMRWSARALLRSALADGPPPGAEV